MFGGLGGIIAGQAFVVIKAKDDTAEGLARTAKHIDNWANKVQKIGQRMTIAGLGMGAPFLLSARSFLAFDNAMRKVEARSTGTAGEMKDLRVEVKRLAADFIYTAGQIGEAGVLLVQKRFTRKQAKEMLPGIVTLARATGEGFNHDQDIATSAALVSGTIKAFGLDASQATDVADIFTVAINNANLNLTQMLEGMKDGGTMAKAMGSNLQEYVAAVAMITDVNIPAESASKALRNMYMRISNSTHRDKFERDIEAMTGKTLKLGDASGNMLPLHESLFRINEAIKDMGNLQQGELLSDLFGMRAVVSAGQLSRSAEAWKQIMAELDNRKGKAASTAAIIDSGLGGAWNKLISSLDLLGVAVIEQVAGSFIKLLEVSKELVNWTTKFVEKNRELLTILAYSAIAMTLAGTAALTLAVGLKVAAFAFYGLSVAVFMTSIPFRLVRYTILGLAAVFKFIGPLLLGLISVFTSTPVLIGMAILSLAMMFEGFRNSMSRALSGIAEKFGEKFGYMWEVIKNFFTNVVTALGKGEFAEAWHLTVSSFAALWDGAVDIMASAWEGFTNYIMETWTAVANSVMSTWMQIQNTIQDTAARSMFELAASDGILGDIASAVLGVDVGEEIRTAERIGNTDGLGIAYDALDQKKKERTDSVNAANKARIEAMDKVREANAERAKTRAALRKENEERIDSIIERIKASDPLAHGDRKSAGPMLGPEIPGADFVPGGGSSSIVPQAIQGLEKGTMEMWKKFYKNKEGDTNEKIKEAAEATAAGVARIETLIEGVSIPSLEGV